MKLKKREGPPPVDRTESVWVKATLHTSGMITFLGKIVTDLDEGWDHIYTEDNED